ncbi:MAG: ATP-binding cassette domain-containing protein, partial [Patescibacteria group bacterium]
MDRNIDDPKTHSQSHYDVVSKTDREVNRKSHQILVEDVVKVYNGSDGPKTVLDNVDLQVSKGEFVAVVGPSGCGKSTLLRLILGEENPTSGILCVDGEPIGYPDASRGIVYQQ